MRAQEFVTDLDEDISRRGFLGGMFGAAGLGAAGYGALQSQKPDLPSQADTDRENAVIQRKSNARSAELATQGAEPQPFDPAKYRDYLTKVARTRGLTTDSALAGFLGQVEVETRRWATPAESFKYSDPVRVSKIFTSNFPTPQSAQPYIGNQVALANRALAGKLGNGDERSGDGWRYRGRGFIHITGRALYAEAGRAIHPENPDIYVKNPTLLSTDPREAALASIWYYLKKVGTARTGNQVSRVVNPAGLKKGERKVAMAKIQQQLKKERGG